MWLDILFWFSTVYKFLYLSTATHRFAIKFVPILYQNDILVYNTCKNSYNDITFQKFFSLCVNISTIKNFLNITGYDEEKCYKYQPKQIFAHSCVASVPTQLVFFFVRKTKISNVNSWNITILYYTSIAKNMNNQGTTTLFYFSTKSCFDIK